MVLAVYHLKISRSKQISRSDSTCLIQSLISSCRNSKTISNFEISVITWTIVYSADEK